MHVYMYIYICTIQYKAYRTPVANCYSTMQLLLTKQLPAVTVSFASIRNFK